MPELCPNPWYFGGCESTIQYLWRWTDSWQRWDLYALALKLAYVVVIVVLVSHRYYLAQRAEPVDITSDEFQRARKKLIAELSRRVSGLKSVAATAPYLGLVGTCVGILGAFGPIVMPKSAALAAISSEVGAALLSTAAGILVALLATFFYNFFRARIDSLETEVDSKWRKRGARCAHFAQSLPLAPLFSKLPFPVVAAPVLALSITAFMTFPSFNIPRGLLVGLAPDRCASAVYERVIVLHITGAGKVLINTEEEDWSRLADRLSQIYSSRADRTLYLLADDEVRFQTVADAIDLANSTSFTGTSDHLGINVKLITPAAMNTHCPGVLQAPPTYPKLVGKNSNRIRHSLPVLLQEPLNESGINLPRPEIRVSQNLAVQRNGRVHAFDDKHLQRPRHA
jgi:biopolymer transport protein ExbD